MNALYLEDSYLKEFDAVVESVTDKFVVLDKTAFFPVGGGLPCDTGKLIKDGKEFPVVFVKKVDNGISHEVSETGLEKGDKVRGVLDWSNRYTIMRYHTAAHALSNVFHESLNVLVTGNQISLDKARFDFNLEKLDREKIESLIEETNEKLKEGAEIKIYTLLKEEAMKIPGIVKLANAFPPDLKELRIVEIVGIDTQADGGPHVANTKEIGEIKLIKLDNKGKNNRRIYFTLGKIK